MGSLCSAAPQSARRVCQVHGMGKLHPRRLPAQMQENDHGFVLADAALQGKISNKHTNDPGLRQVRLACAFQRLEGLMRQARWEEALRRRGAPAADRGLERPVRPSPLPIGGRRVLQRRATCPRRGRESPQSAKKSRPEGWEAGKHRIWSSANRNPLPRSAVRPRPSVGPLG